MRVYAAGASAEIDRARRVIAALRAEGLEITFDWPADIDEAGGRANAGLTEEERVATADACLKAAHDCEVLLLLVPHARTCGAWTELGVAYACERTIVMSGEADDFDVSIMTAVADRTYRMRRIPGELVASAQLRADDQAIAWIAGLASVRGAVE